MAALQHKTTKEGFLKGDEILMGSLLQSVKLGDSPAPQVSGMKQNLIKVLCGKCDSDKLWLWLKSSKMPPQNLPEWMDDHLDAPI